jgi:hypothetical protein
MFEGNNSGTNPGPGPTPTPGPGFGPSYGSSPGGGFEPTQGGPVNALTVNYWLKQHWKLLLIILFAVFLLGETIFQIVYPSSRLIPGTVVDGVNLGGMKIADAAKKLDGEYGNLKLDIFFGKNDAAFQSPKLSDVGIGVNNTDRLSAISYPFYMRIIPTSVWWFPQLQTPGKIGYTYDKDKIADYTLSKVGSDCSIPPQNATLKLIESQLQVVPSVSGGKCDINNFQDTLAQVKPDPDKQNKVRIDINETAAPITDDIARALAAKLNGRLATPMPITVDASTADIPGRVVLSWLDFKADVPEQSIDNTGNFSASLKFNVNKDRMTDYLDQNIASKLIKKPGVSKVSTRDFTETSRVNGASGRDLDVPKITQSVEDYINSKIQKALGATVVVGPMTVYTRSYSPTSIGFSALLAQFAQDNPGTWSMAFQELSGVEHPRSAQYRGDAKMPAAGIHALYLAYTDVMEEYAGVARPVDIISGDTTALDCFRLMIQRSDDGCRKGFYNYFGYPKLTSRAAEIGLKNTVFAGEDSVTSANDLQLLMIGIFKNKIARVEGGQKVLSDARSIRSNEGIPAGSGTGQISHLVGENDTMHNDTAVIYSTNYGAYALTVMSKDSDWPKISELAKKIISLKSVKIPKGAV